MPSPKQRVLVIDSNARLDHSEFMLNAGKPCYFVRLGWEGAFLHDGLYRSARAAWKAADETLRMKTLQTVIAEHNKRMAKFNARMAAA